MILMSASGATRRISGMHFSAANAFSRRCRVSGSKPGSARVSQPNQQGTGTTLEAVPPSIWVTWWWCRADRSAGRAWRSLRSSSMRGLADQAAGVGDRVDPVLRHARVGRPAGQLDAPAHGALVAVDHAHAGRLADEHARGTRQRLAELGDHRPHAEAADFLVVGEGQVDRLVQFAIASSLAQGQRARGTSCRRCRGRRACRRAPRERVAAPDLPVDRNNVGVAREHDAAVVPSAAGMVASRLALSPSGVGTRWLAMPCPARYASTNSISGMLVLELVVSKATSRASSSFAVLEVALIGSFVGSVS